jgi:hypothetical protein
MDERTQRVAELLHQAGETHHVVFAIVDGDDPDWATWYSEWLLSLSSLPDVLGSTPVRSELTWMLVGLDKEYVEHKLSQRWEDYYAARLVERFGQPAGNAPPQPGV